MKVMGRWSVKTVDVRADGTGLSSRAGTSSPARARFGSAALTADECRDARGTAFVDNTVRDIHYALRTFRRAPLAACTIVVMRRR